VVIFPATEHHRRLCSSEIFVQDCFMVVQWLKVLIFHILSYFNNAANPFTWNWSECLCWIYVVNFRDCSELWQATLSCCCRPVTRGGLGGSYEPPHAITRSGFLVCAKLLFAMNSASQTGRRVRRPSCPSRDILAAGQQLKNGLQLLRYTSARSHKMTAKMCRIRWQLRLRPTPRWRSLRCSPRPLVG